MQIVLCFLRKLRELLDSVCRLLPTRKDAVVDFELVKNVGFGRKAAEPLSTIFIFYANGNLVQSVQDVELGDDHRTQPIDPCAVTRCGNIEPPATAGATGYGSVFASSRPELFPIAAKYFGWKWSAAHARCIGF